jgi:hypothetical protein
MFARRPENTGGTGAGSARTAVSLVAAGLLLGGVTTVVLRTASDWLAPGDAGASAAPVPHVVVPARPVTKAVNVTPVPSPAKAVNLTPAPSPAKPVNVTPAPSPAKAVNLTPAPSPAKAAPVAALHPNKAPIGVQTPAHLDDQVTYQYNALGRRDPFQSMVGGDFVGADVGGDAPVDVGGMKVVGIVWGSEDRFALVEDGRGNSLVLRAGDKVMDGVVESLRRDAVVVKLTMDGQTQSVAIPLTRKGDHSNANR